MGHQYGEGPGLDHSEPLFGTGKVRYELVKVKPAAVLSCTMISASVHGVLGHWNGHATRPHEKENCEACKRNCAFKWNGYFFACKRREGVVFIVQIPAGPYPSFLKFQDEFGTLAGCRLSLWRHKHVATGAVCVNILPPDLGGWALPKVPDIRGPLDRIFWGGYRNLKYAEASTDSGPVQSQFTDDLPRGVVPVELSNGKKKSNKQPSRALGPVVGTMPLDDYIAAVSDSVSLNGKKR